jgi:exonuclease SbcC
MEGFLAYRHRTEIDFSDADLFVLAGPTGSGKSSVIDGMTFALYGAIPRLDDRRSVAPVISAMSDQARVSFQFTVGDETFTAVRLVQRTRTGATTTEARLQRGEDEEVLAGNADEVTVEVTRLLGLSYDHFTKAVVLPQGAFADFLTYKPKDRQALLRALLGLGLFEQVMQLANARARTAEGRSEALQENLAKLDVPAEEKMEEALGRLVMVTEAGAELPARLEKLGRLDEAERKALSAHSGCVDSVARLGAIVAPPDLETMEQDRVKAVEGLAGAEKALAMLIDARKALDEMLAAEPDLSQLQTWRSDRARLDNLVADRSGLDLERLSASVEEAAAARHQARAALDRFRVEHAAHELRQGLKVGDPCPVCQGVISTIRADEPGRGLGSGEVLVAELEDSETRAADARDRLKEAEGQSRQIDQRIAELDESVGSAPSPDAVESSLTAVKDLLDRTAANDQLQAAARIDLEVVQATVSHLHERAAGLRESLFAVRDRVAGEQPPLPGDDVVEGWRAFEGWRLDLLARRSTELDGLGRIVEGARVARSRASSELASWLESMGVEAKGSPETDLALAVERRRSEVQELEKTLSEAIELREKLEIESARAQVASALGNHLRSNNFEAWLLEEALDVLVDGANHLLDELSGGAYSLLVRDSQFEVVDHRNARLTRTTRSLSGGETFLVALSLALSMAEQLAALTGTSSRLESVFLDEGFGSLDQESLDVVASVLDELVGGGRTVGIVTHIRELADRIPVRFEVTKGPETASLVKVVG